MGRGPEIPTAPPSGKNLAHEYVRLRGSLMIVDAVAEGVDPQALLPFYRLNRTAFVPPTEEQAEIIFHRHVRRAQTDSGGGWAKDIRRRFDEVDAAIRKNGL